MRTSLRRDCLGFVYQYHNLLPDFDAVENVMLPLLIAGANPDEIVAMVNELVEAHTNAGYPIF